MITQGGDGGARDTNRTVVRRGRNVDGVAEAILRFATRRTPCDPQKFGAPRWFLRYVCVGRPERKLKVRVLSTWLTPLPPGSVGHGRTREKSPAMMRNKTPLRVSPTDVPYLTVTKHRVPNRLGVQHGPSPENRLRTATGREVRIVRPRSPLVIGGRAQSDDVPPGSTSLAQATLRGDGDRREATKRTAVPIPVRRSVWLLSSSERCSSGSVCNPDDTSIAKSSTFPALLAA